eukprot:23275-Prorocentrum_minimum.AAC.3
MASPQRSNMLERTVPSSPNPTLKGMDDKENCVDTKPGGSTPSSVREQMIRRQLSCDTHSLLGRMRA